MSICIYTTDPRGMPSGSGWYAIGKCSLCSGDVVSFYGAYNGAPPATHCNGCKATVDDSYDPKTRVIRMKKAEQGGAA
jgi:hypothetical protein